VAHTVFLKLAARALARNRRRSLITLIAVAVGHAGLVFLWGYVGGINRQMIGNITSYLTGHLQVHRQGYHDDPTLDLAFAGPGGLAERLAAIGTVAAIAPRVEGEALASGPEKTRGVLVVGVDPERERAVTTLARAIKDGSYLESGDPQGIVLGSRVAEVLRVTVEDEVTLVTQAADGSIGAGRYRVRGIYASGIDLIDGAYAFLTLSAAQELFVLDGRVTTLAVQLAELDRLPAARAALARELGPGYEVLGWERLMPGLADNVEFHELLTYIILFVVFVVVALGLANTILMGVMERTHEFGVMLALGTAPAYIARIVLYEALLLGLAGVALGDALGAGVVTWFGGRGLDMSQYAKAVQMMPGLTGIVYPHIGGGELLLLSALILATTVVASVYPAWKAATLMPVAAIRGTRPALRGVRLSLRLPLAAGAVFARIAARAIARNPRRALLTLGALAAGLAAYLFLSALSTGFFLQMRDNATDLVTGHVQIEVRGFRDEFDAKLKLTRTDELLTHLRAQPQVAAAAPRLQALTMAASPTQTEPVMLYGVDPEAERTVTRLHEKIREGRYLSPDRPPPHPSPARGEGGSERISPTTGREIVIGRKLAERLAVRLGEKIVLMAPAGDGTLGSAALRIAGIFETDNELLDRGVALTSLTAMRELLSVPREAATLALRLTDIETAEVVVAALGAQLTAPGQQAVTWKTLLPEVVQMLELIRVNLIVILIVVFVVVALGATNTLLMAVLERTREFGLQLALGTRPGLIVRTVLYESMVLGVLGLAAGFALGALIVGYYHTFGFDLAAYAAATRTIPGMTSVVYPTLVLGNVWLPMLALLVTSLAAALYPAWRAARLDPVVALRRI
jgi:ABC-type lipoprotein release transport system permease subunit